MSEEVKDKFEVGIFWELYKNLEHQFQNFLEYVPYMEGNENVYSFRLLNLILSIGGHVDSAFKEMVNFRDLPTSQRIRKIRTKLERVRKARVNQKRPDKKDYTTMWELFEIFEKIYGLSKQTVIYKVLLLESMSHKPFEAIKNDPNHGWWNIYNGLKHDVSFNLKEASLQNTLHALASAFLLNTIHKPSIVRLYDSRILKPCYKVEAGRYTVTIKKISDIPRHIVQASLQKNQSLPFMLETPLFIYDYNKWGKPSRPS